MAPRFLSASSAALLGDVPEDVRVKRGQGSDLLRDVGLVREKIYGPPEDLGRLKKYVKVREIELSLVEEEEGSYEHLIHLFHFAGSIFELAVHSLDEDDFLRSQAAFHDCKSAISISGKPYGLERLIDFYLGCSLFEQGRAHDDFSLIDQSEAWLRKSAKKGSRDYQLDESRAFIFICLCKIHRAKSGKHGSIESILRAGVWLNIIGGHVGRMHVFRAFRPVLTWIHQELMWASEALDSRFFSALAVYLDQKVLRSLRASSSPDLVEIRKAEIRLRDAQACLSSIERDSGFVNPGFMSQLHFKEVRDLIGDEDITPEQLSQFWELDKLIDKVPSIDVDQSLETGISSNAQEDKLSEDDAGHESTITPEFGNAADAAFEAAREQIIAKVQAKIEDEQKRPRADHSDRKAFCDEINRDMKKADLAFKVIEVKTDKRTGGLARVESFGERLHFGSGGLIKVRLKASGRSLRKKVVTVIKSEDVPPDNPQIVLLDSAGQEKPGP